jgi:hypothetical protein
VLRAAVLVARSDPDSKFAQIQKINAHWPRHGSSSRQLFAFQSAVSIALTPYCNIVWLCRGVSKHTVINVKNPPALSLGENRVYFGLWALMKSPLLLSSDLPSLVPEVIDIINNTDVIAVK